MKLKTKIIETERLILRPYNIEDVTAVYQGWASDVEATKYVSWPTHRSLQDSADYVTFAMESAEFETGCEWAITLKDSCEVIGSLGVSIQNERVGCVNSGYIIGKSFWHQGYTSEAYAAVIDYLFRETEVQRIEAWHDPNNPNSGAVMRKCGLTYEGTMRKSDINNTGICDKAGYSILKEEYL